jgi:hypothetical protein
VAIRVDKPDVGRQVQMFIDNGEYCVIAQQDEDDRRKYVVGPADDFRPAANPTAFVSIRKARTASTRRSRKQ